ncbi:MAG: YgiQ family radical SAM protein [Dysgonamonadaceae bacterium]|jgi:uncharacterized radical SAM protein YgiQ|nr:YgiQ family radical SAM protein [Dysgonamonadaceae bacterium]
MNSRNLTDWLPTTKKEVALRGWDALDVILFSGDAYVDHPSFGAAVIGRTLESLGLRVAIVPQPNWRDDLRDFRKLGKPRRFFAVSAGAMDSMINKYTANKRLRSDDAYTPDARPDMRPEYPTIVYSRILKQLYPDTPVVIGGIEASLRRLSHYDYWQDRLRPSILVDSGADALIYGMGELPVTALASALENRSPDESDADIFARIPQTAYLTDTDPPPRPGDIRLASFEACLKDKKQQALNFRHIEEESNRLNASRLIQPTGNRMVVVNPPYPPMTTEELDRSYDLPYTRLPHPKYQNKHIPAYEMIRHSINIHRGCFGGCAFCTISAHQGKFISSRSLESILKEVQIIKKMPDFKGYISDLGGPSANMYRMQGIDLTICGKCKKPSCIFPSVCPNLNVDSRPLLELYAAVDRMDGIKKSFIGSGIRYDLLLAPSRNEEWNKSARAYINELVTNHVSGRLKIAPEHTSDSVLHCIRKPSFNYYRQFKARFDEINKQQHLKQQLIPYFISSHPACTETDMAELAVISKSMNIRAEQIQDFTPTPMTLSTEIYYTGYHPYTLKQVYTARTKAEKLSQRSYFFWYDDKYKKQIQQALLRLKRADLLKKLY